MALCNQVQPCALDLVTASHITCQYKIAPNCHLSQLCLLYLRYTNSDSILSAKCAWYRRNTSVLSPWWKMHLTGTEFSGTQKLFSNICWVIHGQWPWIYCISADSDRRLMKSIYFITVTLVDRLWSGTCAEMLVWWEERCYCNFSWMVVVMGSVLSYRANNGYMFKG